MITAFQSNAFQSNAFQIVVADPSLVGIAGLLGPEKKLTKRKEEIRRKRIAQGHVNASIRQAVEESVAKAVAQGKEHQTASADIDLDIARMEMQSYLLNSKKEWLAEYMTLLASEYERVQMEARRIREEDEDQQIILLLFQL